MKPQIEVGLNAVIVAVTEEIPRILSLHVEDAQRLPLAALPYGPLDVGRDSTLELGLRRWVEEQTGIRPGYAEQLYTFGDRNRDPGDARLLSVAYLALVREQTPPVAVARWSNWYAFLPWEDWREGRPGILDRDILPALGRWMDSSPQDRMLRRERIEVCFGWGGAPWNWERVLERYELLFEAKLVPEAWRRQSTDRPSGVPRLGRPMFLDHRRILATSLDRLRGKLKYRPVVFELLPPEFTLLQLQRLVEALEGVRLHKQNFRRLVERAGLVEGTSQLHTRTGGRPAELFHFRKEVLKERPAPGVGLPGVS